MSIAQLSPAKDPIKISPATQAVSTSVKVTLYIDKQLVKEFKKRAIDEGLQYSELAELAFSAYLQDERKVL